MSKVKNTQTAKLVVNTKNAKSKTKEIAKFNLEQFTDSLKNFEAKATNAKRSILYNYPETFKETDINSVLGKRFRNRLRSKLQNFCNNIFVYAKTNDAEKLQIEVDFFNAFYKENYRINDYTISSLTNSPKEGKNKDLETLLSIVKEVNK